MHLNKKGMTLIEVIVVLLLSSILMVIAGGLLLNSMGYFNRTAQSNYEKQAVDAISSYVRGNWFMPVKYRLPRRNRINLMTGIGFQ